MDREFRRAWEAAGLVRRTYKPWVRHDREPPALLPGRGAAFHCLCGARPDAFPPGVCVVGGASVPVTVRRDGAVAGQCPQCDRVHWAPAANPAGPAA